MKGTVDRIEGQIVVCEMGDEPADEFAFAF